MIKFHSKKNINLSSKDTMQLTVKENDAQLSSNNGDIQLQSAKDIILMGSGEAAVILQQQSNILQHTEDNQTIWRGKNITINATNINIYSNNAPHNNISSVQASGVSGGADTQETQATKNSALAETTEQSDQNPASIATIKNQGTEKKPDPDDAEYEFKLFVATVYGEALSSYQGNGQYKNSSVIAWKAVASVIMNRVQGPHEFRHFKTVVEVIKHPGAFDAVSGEGNAPFEQAMQFMNARPGWVLAPDAFQSEIIYREQPKYLSNVLDAVRSIYNKQDKPITNAVFYFSPRAQDWQYNLGRTRYASKEIRKQWQSANRVRVFVDLQKTDDFEFFTFKK